MNKNECYTIDVYKYEDFLKEKEKELNYAHEFTTLLRASMALEKNSDKVCSFTICDTLDDSDETLKELLEKYKLTFNNDVTTVDIFYFRKFQNIYNKITKKQLANVESKPNIHLTRKKKIK